MITERRMKAAIYAAFVQNQPVAIDITQFVEPWRTIYLLAERDNELPIHGYDPLHAAIQAVAGDDRDRARSLRAEIEDARHPFVARTLREIGETLTPVSWLWENWIPRGMISLLGAFPGAGKSYLALDLARAVISGAPMPDGSRSTAGPAASVIYVEAEAIPQVTIARARALGLDLDSIYMLMAKEDDIFDLTTQRYRDEFIDLAEEVQPDLIIVDSLSTISTKGQNSVEDTTRLLMLLGAVARENDCGLLIIHHLRKPGSGQLPLPGVSIHDFRGSSHIIAMARTVLGLSIIQTGRQFSLNGPRRIDLVKTNLGPYPDPLGAVLVEEGDIAAFQYGPAPDYDQPTQAQTCEEWLLAYLEEHGPTHPKDVLVDASEQGFSRATLYRARKNMGDDVIDTQKPRHPANKWALPGQIDDEDDQLALDL